MCRPQATVPIKGPPCSLQTSSPLILSAVLSPLSVCFIHTLCLFGLLFPFLTSLSLSLFFSIVMLEMTWDECSHFFLRRAEDNGMDAVHDSLSVKGHMFYFQVTHIHNCLPKWIFKQKIALTLTVDNWHPSKIDSQSGRRSAVVGPTN